MDIIDSAGLDFRSLNERLRQTTGDTEIINCCGQRFIGAGMAGGNIVLRGTPGNALGAYLNGASITVRGNAQDAVGDTMNAGKIIIHGDVGDAAGYAMRGGDIFVRGKAGYRAGIHMKAYRDKAPHIVVGGAAGSFLGEYQAGGIIVVLGLGEGGRRIVGNFPCTGMHGGKMFLRSRCGDVLFPPQVTARSATDGDMEEITGILLDFCDVFAYDISMVLGAPFTVITPDSANPYRRMYVAN